MYGGIQETIPKVERDDRQAYESVNHLERSKCVTGILVLQVNQPSLYYDRVMRPRGKSYGVEGPFCGSQLYLAEIELAEPSPVAPA